MTLADENRALEELATLYGLTRSYWDGTGQFRRACDEAVAAVLHALGAPLERPSDATEALRQVRESAKTAPPVVVTTAGEGDTEIRVPHVQARHATLRLEAGSSLPAHVTRAAADGSTIRASEPLPVGYHLLQVDDGERVHAVHVLAAPARLPSAPRGWALFAPLYALRRVPAARAFPTYGDLVRLADWMTDAAPPVRGGRGAAYLGTLPLLAGFFEEPFEPSPYSPISRAFWTELYVDPAASPEHEGLTLARDDDTAKRAGLIDYRREMRRRRAAIEALLHRLDERGGRRRDELDRALERDAELAGYAAFRAAVERYGTTWQHWPERAQGGDLRAGADYDGGIFRYHAYAQWLAREQVAAAAAASPAGLYLDLPLGAHGGGYDTWRHRRDFARGVSTGAPPDAVFEGGQDWGFPPLDPERARTTCYAGFRAALRHHFEHAALLRVDHVMGLHRLFWVPHGFTAADGVYVRAHADELWGVLAIEASRARGGLGAAVVGEDLGTVPDEVRTEMHARGALRMYVAPFEVRDDAAAPLAAPPDASLACLGTHDMEPFAAWWDRDSTRREAIAAMTAAKGPNAEDVLPALLAWLSSSGAAIVAGNLEDFWLEHERQNLPGIEAADRNWKRPFARSFEEFRRDPSVVAALRAMRGGPSPAACECHGRAASEGGR